MSDRPTLDMPYNLSEIISAVQAACKAARERPDSLPIPYEAGIDAKNLAAYNAFLAAWYLMKTQRLAAGLGDHVANLTLDIADEMREDGEATNG